jgi:hypothetical protein
MPDQLMTRDEIVRRLRLVTSGRVRHRPLTMAAIGVRCGPSRVAVYDALHGIMGDDVQRVLPQVLAEEMPGQRVQETIAGSAGLGPARRAPER